MAAVIRFRAAMSIVARHPMPPDDDIRVVRCYWRGCPKDLTRSGPLFQGSGDCGVFDPCGAVTDCVIGANTSGARLIWMRIHTRPIAAVLGPFRR